MQSYKDNLYKFNEIQFRQEAVGMIDEALVDIGIKIYKPERLGDVLVSIGKKYCSILRKQNEDTF